MPDKFSISMLCEAAACVKGNVAAKTQKVPAGDETFHQKGVAICWRQVRHK